MDTIKSLKLKAGIKKAWIAALKSGKYKQGLFFLKHTSNDNELSYCCLGVLCETIAPELLIEVKPGIWKVENAGNMLSPTFWMRVAEKPEAWNKFQDTLCEMNDVTLKSFDEIANFIDRIVPDD
jgi:hypothetical protein